MRLGFLLSSPFSAFSRGQLCNLGGVYYGLLCACVDVLHFVGVKKTICKDGVGMAKCQYTGMCKLMVMVKVKVKVMDSTQ